MHIPKLSHMWTHFSQCMAYERLCTSCAKSLASLHATQALRHAASSDGTWAANLDPVPVQWQGSSHVSIEVTNGSRQSCNVTAANCNASPRGLGADMSQIGFHVRQDQLVVSLPPGNMPSQASRHSAVLRRQAHSTLCSSLTYKASTE